MAGTKEIQKAYEAILAGDFEQAIAWFGLAIDREPDNASFHYKLSITYARSNKLREAIKHADMAVQLEPEDAYYRIHLNILQAKELVQKAEKQLQQSNDRLPDCIVWLKTAITLDPLLLEAYLLLGITYERLGEYDPAILAISEVLRLDPQHTTGNRLLARYENKRQQGNKNNHFTV
ncbi:tetratricopeptide repeat protein [Paenibacillus thalictri]|uniref:tetratricopeptide repeat protein n=1 Tax=Paenibacillus thalictri TaxID=2527873 RepID=UPI001F1131A0|nr:tetratricopeptide repeat protein [Paenibacillus thalictri]